MIDFKYRGQEGPGNQSKLMILSVCLSEKANLLPRGWGETLRATFPQFLDPGFTGDFSSTNTGGKQHNSKCKT